MCFGCKVNVHMTAGSAAAIKDTAIPFALRSDTDSIVHCANGRKVPSCLANLACDAAAKLGLTELSLDDHVMVQVVDEDWVWLAMATMIVLIDSVSHLSDSMAQGIPSSSFPIHSGHEQENHVL